MNGRLLPGGYSWIFLVGGVPPGSPNPDPISDQKVSFFAPVLRPGPYEIMSLLLRLGQQQNRFLKIHFEFSCFSFFLTHLELKQKYVRTCHRSSLENHTRFQTKMSKVHPFSDQKGAKPPAKTLPDGAAHTYMAYIGKYPPSPLPEGVC